MLFTFHLDMLAGWTFIATVLTLPMMLMGSAPFGDE